MGVFDDQKAVLATRLQAVNERIGGKQQELAQLQAEKQAVQQDVADLRAAYLAWKGTPL